MIRIRLFNELDRSSYIYKIYIEALFLGCNCTLYRLSFFLSLCQFINNFDLSTIAIKKNKIIVGCADTNRVIQSHQMNRAVLPAKQDHALMETLTAETANSSPRETQLITRATTPNKHTLGRAIGCEKFK